MQQLITAITERLSDTVSADARRLFHGRGQCYQGLDYINVDWFAPVLLITLYRQPDAADWDSLLDGIAPLTSVVDCALVQRRYQRGAPIESLWGQPGQQPLASERGLSYALSFGGKQNIGFFMDMAPGRAWLRQRATDKRVLNLFAYTCSFSVAAIAGGAHSVLNIDMSRAALSVGRQNHQLNNQQAALRRDVQFLPYNIFRSWNKIAAKGPYDIVIIDPPSRQKGSFIAVNDYARVLGRLEPLMADGADILACLNAPELAEDFLHDVFAAQCPRAQLVERLPTRADFPERDSRRNLKMLHYHLPAAL